MKELVIFDIEASCEDKRINPRYNMETIELGAVKIADGIIVDEFKTFIKPEYVNKLTPFCTELTGITYDDLKDAPSFNEGILDFYSFIYGLPIYSCGEFDRKFLTKELREKGTNYSHIIVEEAINSSHKNLKKNYSNITGEKMAGMNKMAHFLNIEIDGDAHRALDDSRNLAKIYIKLEQIRKSKLAEVFNDSRLVKIIEKINAHHNRNFTLVSHDNIEDSANFDKMDSLAFLDKWRDVIITDHTELGLNYLNSKELSSIRNLAGY